MAASPGAGIQSKEVVYDLEASAFSSDHFRMHEFKVKRCPRARPHDWTQCPFAHPGEKARRRDPQRYRYSGTACPEFRKSGCCRRGDACPFAHGVFECWLHPSRYRTQLCTDGASCKRRVCFFAHSESELRRPEDDPVVAQCQVQAELAAEVQTLQHQHLTQALSALVQANGGRAQGALSGSPLNLLALELLKQAGQPAQPPGGSANAAAQETDLQLELLQQLALMEQVQKHQQQQRAQAQQLLNSLNDHSGRLQGADPKTLQTLIAAMDQNRRQQTLKEQLAEQLKAHNPALEALNLLAGGAVRSGAVPAENHQPKQLPGSTPFTVLNGAVSNLGVGGSQMQEQAIASAAMALNSALGTFDTPGSVTAGVPVGRNGTIQMPGHAAVLQTNGSLDTIAPGQLASLRAHALTGGRRSIDNGVLARSVSSLVDAIDASNAAAQPSLLASLAGGTVSDQVLPMAFSSPISTSPEAQNLDANGAYRNWSEDEALKHAKNLLENLSLLQGGKNSSSGNGLLPNVNMDTLLAANGISTMNRVTSFENILEELPKNVAEVGPQEGAYLLHHATCTAGERL